MNDEIKKLNKKIRNLELSNEGIWAEYQYVVEKYKTELDKERELAKYYKIEFEQVVNKMEEYRRENEAIKNSRWWKLRNKLKG